MIPIRPFAHYTSVPSIAQRRLRIEVARKRRVSRGRVWWGLVDSLVLRTERGTHVPSKRCIVFSAIPIFHVGVYTTRLRRARFRPRASGHCRRNDIRGRNCQRVSSENGSANKSRDIDSYVLSSFQNREFTITGRLRWIRTRSKPSVIDRVPRTLSYFSQDPNSLRV